MNAGSAGLGSHERWQALALPHREAEIAVHFSGQIDDQLTVVRSKREVAARASGFGAGPATFVPSPR